MSQQTSQRFCLRWNNHQSNLLSVFDQLLQDESFVDVTLAVEGQFLRAHKMVLSACSPYFQTLFVGHPDKHPIVILKDVPFSDMRSLLDFMYRGEVSVDQDRLTAFLKVAETLRIKGLTEVNEDKCDLPSIASSLLSSAQQSAASNATTSSAPPPPELHRIHLTHPSNKRPSSSRASSPGPSSPSYSQKRKRGRQRKLSGCSDGALSPYRNNLLTDSETKQSNMSDSSYGHGPPDLLEVNMSDHGVNSSPSLSDDGITCSPEHEVVLQHEVDEYCYVETISETISAECKNSRENNVVAKSQVSSHHSSERYPSDLPMLRLVPKSELIAAFAKKDSSSANGAGGRILLHDRSNDSNNTTDLDKDDGEYVAENDDNNEIITVHDCMSPPSSLNNGDLYPFNNNHLLHHHNNINNNNLVYRKYSPPAHLLSPPQSMSPANSNDCFPGNNGCNVNNQQLQPSNKPTPNSRRRVRRRAASSNDPAEQLTEMSVRGLNLFRYASVDEGVYKCMECAKADIVKTFKNKYSFQRHAFLYHEGCQRKVFPCPVCGKEFSRPDKMKNHMKTVHDCFMPKEYVIPGPIPYYITPS